VPIPVAALSKVCVCDLWLAGIAGSNPTESMDVRVLCVLKYKFLRLADHSSRGIPPSVVSLSVISKPKP